MKTLLCILVVAAIFIAVPAGAEELDSSRFASAMETGWDLEPTGHMAIYFAYAGRSYVSLHDVVAHGFGVSEESAEGYPYPVRFFSEETPAGNYGYVFRADASVYIALIPNGSSFDSRWIILAVDPYEDGINGNEILR